MHVLISCRLSVVAVNSCTRAELEERVVCRGNRSDGKKRRIGISLVRFLIVIMAVDC